MCTRAFRAKRDENYSSVERSVLSVFLGIFNCKSGTDVIPFKDEGRISWTKLGFLGIIIYFKKSPYTALSEYGKKNSNPAWIHVPAAFVFIHIWRKQNAELFSTIIILIWEKRYGWIWKRQLDLDLHEERTPWRSRHSVARVQQAVQPEDCFSLIIESCKQLMIL